MSDEEGPIDDWAWHATDLECSMDGEALRSDDELEACPCVIHDAYVVDMSMTSSIAANIGDALTLHEVVSYLHSYAGDALDVGSAGSWGVMHSDVIEIGPLL